MSADQRKSTSRARVPSEHTSKETVPAAFKSVDEEMSRSYEGHATINYSRDSNVMGRSSRSRDHSRY